MFKLSGVVILALAVSGCSTFAVPRYSADAETVSALRAVGEVKVKVGAFGNGPGDQSRAGVITCRGFGPVKTPNAEPYSEYVRKALISELLMANIYAESAPVELTGTLDKLNFSSNSGKWVSAMTLTSSNGSSLSVEDTYKFTTSFIGETACTQTALAGMGAVQELIKKAVRDPGFPKLLK
ncbi:hypothetical protein LMG3458_03682 [Achromobacter deleyi]|uniref:Lipoprotein n=1 Tax=Achromobacter deleyi TaxID=1353891 RepID=A0A6S7B588_9BURK|nr:hypothetical protein [Achromobacter deleyi]CAB3717750.1 hypothetical protein LMG3458_03682 [Achromobacter deleyi]CAB3847257.1 hypothetical protein LMG3481_01572 [Achromobacter deleyi]CAB3852889.1 hypothetical protein LMG3412_01847 [Achromobacter deleyi]CAB3854342.1 hypothetical protein LMG3482_01935 [Achromobacter deleyi]